ncbi:PREDICTED: uncharacterized protein LOC106750270 [Dinoponera quadriceps]|uniref:Uncharacterized protein LOC106750270 n=1 Tax=Dinoponera quadriceps TaxID=609295 RepID=A0A6P3Y7E7_DINQU|nr:PREDICTED: uncharacterized protein LOC106750270 [Dinoponera quadriceps]
MKMHPVGIVAVLLVIGTEILGYPPQERIMPDETPVPEDAAEHEDSVASASEVSEEYDDSDMYMEPDETTSLRPGLEAGTTRKSDEEETSTETAGEKRSEAKPAADQEARNSEEAARFAADGASLETESQNFFPSFAELFANHRLPFAEQQRYRPNRFLGYFQRERNYQAAASATKDQHSLLGSGNFGVIRGGTYYPEDKENDEYSVDESLYNPYYHGRGRAQYHRNPKPQPVRGGDFFANFRDFADITAPPKSSFSHLSVVYANRNGSDTVVGRVTEPRNIIETLRMLEEEEEEERGNAGEEEEKEETLTTEETPRKKQSKGKRKLMKMKQYEEDKARRSRMSVEPLLALS